MTVAQALGVAVMRLRSPRAPEAIRDSAKADAQILLAEALHCDRSWLLAHGADELDTTLMEIFGVLLDERLRGVPTQYLTHRAGFYGRDFYVDEGVLVPRPESEHLIEAALAIVRARLRGGSEVRVLDVGTGSGALAITIAAEIPTARVTATDASAEAVAIARRNARDLGVGDRVTVLEADLADIEGRFACVIANLPYIPTGDIPQAPNPVGFEPNIALDGGPDGLVLYRRLISQLPARLEAGGAALFEAAPGTIEPLAALCTAAFPNAAVEIGEDYGGLERFVEIRLSEA